MKSSEIIEVIAAPEVQFQREKLYKLGAPVGKLQFDAFRELDNQPGVISQEEAIVFVANCLLQRVKEWEAKRIPKTRAGRIFKWIISALPKFGK